MDTKHYENAVAILLITTEPGAERKVVSSLKNIEEVEEALLLFGEYDIFAKIVCTDFGLLSNVVVSKIRNIAGVESTKTLTAAPML
jgi:DNA-binding Lrp family transcriptional regulator